MSSEEFTMSDLLAARQDLARVEREIIRNLNEDTKTRFAEAYDRVMKIRRGLKCVDRGAPTKLA
jgi:hypothetical protein